MPDLGTMPGSVSLTPKKENQNLEVCFKGSGRTLFFSPPGGILALGNISGTRSFSLFRLCQNLSEGKIYEMGNGLSILEFKL